MKRDTQSRGEREKKKKKKRCDLFHWGEGVSQFRVPSTY